MHHSGFSLRMSKAFCDDFHVLGLFSINTKSPSLGRGPRGWLSSSSTEDKGFARLESPTLFDSCGEQSAFCSEKCHVRAQGWQSQMHFIISENSSTPNNHTASSSYFFMVSWGTAVSYPPDLSRSLFKHKNHKCSNIRSASLHMHFVSFLSCSFRKC